MEIGIIGMPKSGKTTIFNALTKGKAETAAYAPAALQPNIGIAKVEDQRIITLSDMYHPKKVTPAEVKYTDIAIAPADTTKEGSFSSQFLTYLSRINAIIHVVRAFEDEQIPHIKGSVNVARDIDSINTELAFSDLIIIERRLERIKNSLKSARQQERDLLNKEQTLLTKIQNALENDTPVRELQLSEEEHKIIRNYSFLTAKPLLILININEGQLSHVNSIESDLSACCSGAHCLLTALCGKLEMELTQLSDEEAKEFRDGLGIKKSALNRVIELSYDLLGQMSFFTTGADEVKAWTITKGTSALNAAGKIHSDIERGFIRAEIVSYNDLVKCGTMAQARKQGLLRLEGKKYIVQDGDIINFLFNV
ncbi:MAG: redox-regulated ATPase YchF [Dehalococcoidia bacterium]|nr:redox-regulated ATPase YchF [Dehalococcoidia bacterium]